tara:strand:+ start:411 stop:1118 length:708 start_codon:yes stop_codon:yes gene_type:complete
MRKFKIKIFADGADTKHMLALNKKKYIKGLTTNPTLMRASGVKNYELFAKNILRKIKKKPISLEVFSDDFFEMEKQAIKINSWGKNVYVKIPITNSKGKSSFNLIRKLSNRGIKLNVTAITTIQQIIKLKKFLNKNVPCVISVFAGRIADTGRDPIPYMKKAVQTFKDYKLAEVLWASTREILNIIQANNVGCHIITVPPNLLNKINLLNYNLKKYSLDTVKNFYNDAKKSNYKI